MKDISSSLIIDEAINKLKNMKNGQTDCAIVEELYAVRAYCDLLIKTYEKDTKPKQKNPKQVITQQTNVSKSLEDDDYDSIFDF